jgi:hypothetical protein
LECTGHTHHRFNPLAQQFPRKGPVRLLRQPQHIRPASHAPQHPNLHYEGWCNGDPAGHYPGGERLTPPLPPWPTVARENYPLPDTTLMPPLSSSSPRNFMRNIPTTHSPTAIDRRTPSRSRTTCVHGRRGAVVTRATRGGASKVGRVSRTSRSQPRSSRCMIVFYH